MVAKKALLFILIALVAVFGASCSRGKKKSEIKAASGLVARVGDYRITEEQMQRRFDELPEQQKNMFKGMEGQAKFVDELIDQHLLYQAALDDKIEQDEDVKDRVRWLTMNLIVGEYYKKEIADKVKVDDSQIAAYYSDHKEEFYQAPVMRAQYLFTVDSLKAVAWEKRLAKGENFSTIAKAESEDKATASVLGDLGYFNPGGFIKSVGSSDIFSRAIEKLDVGQISPIIHFERGFAIVKITEKNPEHTQTLEEARRTIISKLRGEKEKADYERVVEKLKEKYPSENYIREKLERTTRTAEELWQMAQLEQDPHKRIQFYRDIVNAYPNDKNAPQALFMIGFVYAEELQDTRQAQRTFDELMEKYPQSEMVESAKWMIENMESAHPKIESFENMQQRMKEDQQRKADVTK
jgi:EpsD family peptidyl-prolyl cis-trans isomerase